MDRALDASAQTMARLSEQLRTRQIGLIEWELAMRKEVKAVQLYSAASAKGGLAQLSQADLGRIGAATREQYRRLSAFAQQIEDGLPLDGRFTQRARMYGAAGRGTYHKTERDEKERRGFTQEKNRRYSGDSCPGCVAAEAAGWVAIGELTPVGSRDCLTNCRCFIEYRKAA